MVNALASKGRKLVVIIDPHIKRDSNYFLHNECAAKGYYVKNKDSHDYEGRFHDFRVLVGSVPR